MTRHHQLLFTWNTTSWSHLGFWMFLMAFLTNCMLAFSWKVCSLANKYTISVLFQLNRMIPSKCDGSPVFPHIFFRNGLYLYAEQGLIKKSERTQSLHVPKNTYLYQRNDIGWHWLVAHESNSHLAVLSNSGLTSSFFLPPTSVLLFNTLNIGVISKGMLISY